MPGTVKLQVRTPSGQVRGPYGPFTADAQGNFTGTLPAAATAGLTATAETAFKTTVSIEAVDAQYNDPATGNWASKVAGTGALPLFVPATSLLLENNFTSDVGWVKPGDAYPFRVLVRNYTTSRRRERQGDDPGRPTARPSRSVSPQDRVEHRQYHRRDDHLERRQRAGRRPGGPVRQDARRRGQGRRRSARTRDRLEEPLDDGDARPTRAAPTPTSTSHGPKVIPPSGGLRHGALRRPPVPGRPGRLLRPQARSAALAATSSRDEDQRPGRRRARRSTSTRRCRYGQLFPHGDRALGRRSRPPAGTYGAGFRSPTPAPGSTCHGDDDGRPAGRRSTRSGSRTAGTSCRATPTYYGADGNGSALIGALTGVGALQRHRLGLRPDRQGGLRRRADRRPRDRLRRLRHRQGRRRRLLHDGLPRPRRQRRLAARTRRRPTTTSGRTRRPRGLPTRTRPPGRRATSPTTSARTSRAGRSGAPTRRAPR